MNDIPERLEAELADMRPRALSPQTFAGIECRLAWPVRRRWADAALVCSMGGGALAACVIAAVLVADSSPSPLPAVQATVAIGRHADLSDSPLAFVPGDLLLSDARNHP